MGKNFACLKYIRGSKIRVLRSWGADRSWWGGGERETSGGGGTQSALLGGALPAPHPLLIRGEGLNAHRPKVPPRFVRGTPSVDW